MMGRGSCYYQMLLHLCQFAEDHYATSRHLWPSEVGPLGRVFLQHGVPSGLAHHLCGFVPQVPETGLMFVVQANMKPELLSLLRPKFPEIQVLEVPSLVDPIEAAVAILLPNSVPTESH
eukprot:TRINITY_DN55639_c0_g1_i1.p2 TRINITY_DN55639_c0_g1~~TRINITY_DN55639_c0_g1_i1.p2  ORF type:complete len:119 (+),score=10.52 TRINITY_DN55639_c0_g1_i1:193-549(+)